MFFIKKSLNKLLGPSIFNWLVQSKLSDSLRNLYYKFYGVYPKKLSNEAELVLSVLNSPAWNMMYGGSLMHEKLESKFSQFIGSNYGIAVGSGGMGIQMSLRALGLMPGDEVILQVDTCVATAFAVMNAGCTPIFCDVSPSTFMIDHSAIDSLISKNTRAIIATHMWGNPDNLSELMQFCQKKNIFLIEDGCLSFGSNIDGIMSGSIGHVGIFSFGCLKPIQGGEGGMVVTNSNVLAKELRTLRYWGDREREYGRSDMVQLAWNGRMSEIIAAVVLGQLNGYEKHLQEIRGVAGEFTDYVNENCKILSPVYGGAKDINGCGLTQLTFKINDFDKDKNKKERIIEQLKVNNILAGNANFRLINTISFFKEKIWKNWVLKGDLDKAEINYESSFPVAEKIYNEIGFGLPKINYISYKRLPYLKRIFSQLYI